MQAFVEQWTEEANRYGLAFELLTAGGDIRARNAAIRQARGEFILVTNADARFSAELVQFLAARRLEQHCLYRIDTLLTAGSVDQVTGVCAREGAFALTADGLRRNDERDIAAVDSGVHFGAGWFPVEPAAGAPFRWIENHAEILLRMQSTGRVLAL